MENIFNINFFAPVVLSQLLLKKKLLQKGGSIVFLSSIDGPVTAHMIHNDDITQEQLNKDMELYPLKRYADPREIAWAIIYLLSDASTFTIGASLVVDGGFTIL